MDVLLRLAAAPGEVVPRETLLADAWPRRMVNDDVLSRAIADLRIALRRRRARGTFIETLPKVGYRLIAPVRARRPGPATASDPAPGPRAAASVAAWRRGRRTGDRDGFAALLAIASRRLAATGVPDREQLTAAARAGRAVLVGPSRSRSRPRFSPDGRASRSRSAKVAARRSSSAACTRTRRDRRSATRGRQPVARLLSGRQAHRLHAPHADPATARSSRTICAAATCSRSSTARARPQARFDIAPDGRRLVYVGAVRAQFPAGLMLRDLATGAEHVLTAPEPDSATTVPALLAGRRAHRVLPRHPLAPRPVRARRRRRREARATGVAARPRVRRRVARRERPAAGRRGLVRPALAQLLRPGHARRRGGRRARRALSRRRPHRQRRLRERRVLGEPVPARPRERRRAAARAVAVDALHQPAAVLAGRNARAVRVQPRRRVRPVRRDAGRRREAPDAARRPRLPAAALVARRHGDLRGAREPSRRRRPRAAGDPHRAADGRADVLRALGDACSTCAKPTAAAASSSARSPATRRACCGCRAGARGRAVAAAARRRIPGRRRSHRDRAAGTARGSRCATWPR